MKLLSRVLFLSLESKAFSLMFESLFPVMLKWFNITANCQLCPFWMTAPCKCLNLHKYHFTIYNILSSLSGSKVKKKGNPTQNLIECTPTQKNQTFPSSKPDSLADSCTEKSLFYEPSLAVAQVGITGYSNAACQPQTTPSAMKSNVIHLVQSKELQLLRASFTLLRNSPKLSLHPKKFNNVPVSVSSPSKRPWL